MIEEEDVSIADLEEKLVAFALDGNSMGTKATLDAIKYLKEKQEKAQEERETLIVKSGKMNLTSNQRKIFKEIASSIDTDQLNASDKILLHIYVKAVDNYIKADAILTAKGESMRFKTGAEQIRPEVNIRNEAQNTIMKISKMMGLDSISRAKLKMPVQVKKEDPLDMLE